MWLNEGASPCCALHYLSDGTSSSLCYCSRVIKVKSRLGSADTPAIGLPRRYSFSLHQQATFSVPIALQCKTFASCATNLPCAYEFGLSDPHAQFTQLGTAHASTFTKHPRTCLCMSTHTQSKSVCVRMQIVCVSWSSALYCAGRTNRSATPHSAASPRPPIRAFRECVRSPSCPSVLCPPLQSACHAIQRRHRISIHDTLPNVHPRTCTSHLTFPSVAANRINHPSRVLASSLVFLASHISSSLNH